MITGCANGADEWARMWVRGVQNYRDGPKASWLGFPANWKSHGKGAGPIRNQKMIDEGKPDLVLAFPGGRGTADMVRRAKAAGVRVIEVPA